MQLPTPQDPSVCGCVHIWLFRPLLFGFSLGLFKRSKNALSLVKRLSKLQPVGPSGCTRASWRCQSGACRNERNVPLLIWVTQAPSALTRLLGSRTRNPFSLARLNMKYRTGVEGGKAEETECFGSVSEQGMCRGADGWGGSPRTNRYNTSFCSSLYQTVVVWGLRKD